MKPKKVAIVYDRVNKWGGAERILLALHSLYPQAPLYTSVYSRKATWAKVFPKVIPTFLQKVPYARDHHELFATLMPLSFESLKWEDEYDLVISVTSEYAKGIIVPTKTLHLCYCLTPTRYLYSGKNEYFDNPFLKFLSKPIVRYLTRWDQMASNRPDEIIAISNEVKNRIQKYYGKNSMVLYPPVDVEKFTPVKRVEKSDYYLVVSRLVKYKKVDMVIRVFNKLNKNLVIVGTGNQEKKLKKISNKNIIFTGEIEESKLVEYYQKARGLIFPQLEDFGLTSIEAQAALTPVIAYKMAGARETVNSKTGVFFSKQNEAALANAVVEFEKRKFKDSDLLQNAEKFSIKQFNKQFSILVKSQIMV